MSLTLKIPGSTLLFENARTAVLSLDLAVSPIVNVGEALDGIDHVLLHWNGGGSTIRTESSWDDPLRPSQSLASGATATWNAFSSDGATTLQAGSADAIGMQEAALVICKPYTAPNAHTLMPNGLPRWIGMSEAQRAQYRQGVCWWTWVKGKKLPTYAANNNAVEFAAASGNAAAVRFARNAAPARRGAPAGTNASVSSEATNATDGKSGAP